MTITLDGLQKTSEVWQTSEVSFGYCTPNGPLLYCYQHPRLAGVLSYG